MFECEKCGKSFTRRDNLQRHLRSSCIGKRAKLEEGHSSNAMKCDYCDEYVAKQHYAAHARSNIHKKNAFVVVDDGVERITGAFGDRIVSYRISTPGYFIDLDEFMHTIREKCINLVEGIINVNGSVKINMECFALYYIESKDDAEIKSFLTKNKIITVAEDLYENYEDFVDQMKTRMADFQERDSGWSLMEILYLEINVNKYNPMRASSYIELPRAIKLKKAVINIQNNDKNCFAWAVTSALYEPTGLPQRTSSYPHFLETNVDYTHVTFPVSLRDIKKFELKNNISINVYGINSWYDGNTTVHDVITLRTCVSKRDRHINLLLITDQDGHSHYCWIKNLSRLVSSQASQNGHVRFICEGCLIHFSSESNLIRHQNEDCSNIKAVLPSRDLKINKFGRMVEENILQFENFEKQLKIPFVVYADFEALLKPSSNIDETVYDDHKSYTVKCFEHKPYAFAYNIKCSYDNSLSKFVNYRGANAAEVFINTLETDIKRIYKNHLSKIESMGPLSRLDNLLHEMSLECHICGGTVDDDDKVYDHDHLTGSYRGPAHSVCNLNYKIPKFIPIFFHNLSNYDCHMFVKNIALNQEEVDVIAQNKEKYVSFSKKVHVDDCVDNKGKSKKIFLKLRFVDSFRFMNCSLEKLGSYLDDNQCLDIQSKFNEKEKFTLIRRKGIFPYSFIDSFEKLNQEKLPERQEFYDVLTDKHISEEDYCRAEKVWQVFNCKTLGEYSDVYLTSDVLLLTDIFENFRTICIEQYKLDPCHYFTAPGFGWDALLRMTRVKLELLTDIDMLHFFKKGIRGGLSMCTKRAAVANNKFLPDYDGTKPNSYILYLDATNLYGHAMRRKLPTGQFRWLSESEILNLDIMSFNDTEIGYVLEVDLEYPEHLHENHDDLPFCPEKIIPRNSKNKKLIANLQNKTKYIIHYINLQQALKNGLKLIKIHRILQFKHSEWMKTYIDFNSLQRENAKNEFEKNHYKAMNNIVFGKTMENVENRVDIRLITHWERRNKRAGAESLITLPNFKSSKVFCENLAAIEMNVVQVRYTKPLYVGFSVLELSKTVIYDFFYNFIKVKYDRNASLLYTDTDSLVLHIFTDNVYDDIISNINHFDTSNYSVDNVHNIPKGRPVLGRMKDEFPKTVLRTFYGTGAKAYCVTSLDDALKKAKGVKKYVIDKNLTVSDYKRVVEEGGCIYKKMYVFRSSYHTMYTELKNKVALSTKDDKRYVLQDGCHTLAWGNKLIPELETHIPVN